MLDTRETVRLTVLIGGLAVAAAATFYALPRRIPSAPPRARTSEAAISRSPIVEAAELLASGDIDGAKRAFDRAHPEVTMRMAAVPNGVVRFSRDGTRAVMQTGETLTVFSTGDWRELARVDASPDAGFGLSPDGRILQVCRSASFLDENARLELVGVDSREIVASISHATCSNAAAFSADGRLFAATTHEGRCDQVVVIDVAAKAVKALVPRDVAGEGECVRFDHIEIEGDGARLRTATSEGAERMWSLATGDLIGTREGYLDVGPDGLGVYLVRSRYGTSKPKRFDTATSKELGELSTPACAAASGAVFAPSGGLVATFGKDFACLWRAREGRFIGAIDIDREGRLRNDQVRFTPDGSAVVLGVSQGESEPTEHARSFSATTAAPIEDLGTVYFVGATEDALLFHDRRARQLLRVTGAQPAERIAFDAGPDRFVFPAPHVAPTEIPEPWPVEASSVSVEASAEGLALLDGATGRLDRLIAEPGTWTVTISADRRWIVGMDRHHHARVWDAVRRRAVRFDEEAEATSVDDLEIERDSLTFSSQDRRMVLELTTGALSSSKIDAPARQADGDPLRVAVFVDGKSITLHPAAPSPTFVLMPGLELAPGVSRVQLGVLDVAVSDDGRAAAVIFAHGDGVVDNDWGCEVRTFELPSGRQTHRFPTQPRIYGLSFHDSGRLLLGTGYDDHGGAWLWDVRSGKRLFEREMNVMDARVLERGERLVLRGGEEELEVWDVKKSAPLLSITGVTAMDVSSDERFVAAYGRGRVRIFDHDGAEARAFAAPLDLAGPERMAFFGAKTDLLALWKGGAVDVVRVTDGSSALSLRLGEHAALVLAGDEVELFGDAERASRFAHCHADGFDFPLAWCLDGHHGTGLLRATLQ